MFMATLDTAHPRIKKYYFWYPYYDEIKQRSVIELTLGILPFIIYARV